MQWLLKCPNIHGNAVKFLMSLKVDIWCDQLCSFLTFMILAVSLRSLSCWKWSSCQSTVSMMLSSRLWRGQSIKRWSCCQSDRFQIVLHSQNLMLLFCVYILTRLPTPLADMQLKPWQSLHLVLQIAVDTVVPFSSPPVSVLTKGFTFGFITP